MFGHVRSRSRATFDEKRQRWISECRRCRIPMMREEDGAWHKTEASPVGKLVPIEAKRSTASSDGADEPPLGSAAAPDAPKRRGARASEDEEKPVEFSAP
jgi:hypothetical protein